MDSRNFGKIQVSPTAATANSVAASQSPGAGAITLDGTLVSGGVATFAEAALVRITSGGNDAGITFTVSGTSADGQSQSETVAGTNASNSDTTKYFKTVTGITKSGAAAGTIVAGNLIGSVSKSIKLDNASGSPQVGLGVELASGTATYTVQHTYENPFGGSYPAAWFDNAAGSKSASSEAVYTSPVAAIRIKVTASSSGVLNASAVQCG